MNIFKQLIFKITNKFHRPKYQLTSRGLYACYYIIEKYINETCNDYNETYEALVDRKLKKIESTNFFSSFYNSDGEPAPITEKDKRDFSALMVVTSMLYECRIENRKQVLEYISDSHSRELVKNCIKEGMVL